MIYIASIDNLTKHITGRDDTHLARDLLGDKGQSAYVKRPLKPYRAAEAGSLV